MSTSFYRYTSLRKFGTSFLLFWTRRQIFLTLLKAIRSIIFWLVLRNFNFQTFLKLLLFLIIHLSLLLNRGAHDIWGRCSWIFGILTSLAWWWFVFSKGKVASRYLHILHFFSILVLRNSERIIFVIKHVLIVIFEIKFVYFVWIFIQILCLVHLRLSTRWNVWFWPSDSSGADGSLFWNCWDTATWCGNASWDSGSWSMIWNVHLISVLVQFIGLNSVMLFRIFRSLMKWPT